MASGFAGISSLESGCYWVGASLLYLSVGGAVSLLALNGLFILIHKHNL